MAGRQKNTAHRPATPWLKMVARRDGTKVPNTAYDPSAKAPGRGGTSGAPKKEAVSVKEQVAAPVAATAVKEKPVSKEPVVADTSGRSFSLPDALPNGKPTTPRNTAGYVTDNMPELDYDVSGKEIGFYDVDGNSMEVVQKGDRWDCTFFDENGPTLVDSVDDPDRISDVWKRGLEV